MFLNCITFSLVFGGLNPRFTRSEMPKIPSKHSKQPRTPASHKAATALFYHYGIARADEDGRHKVQYPADNPVLPLMAVSTKIAARNLGLLRLFAASSPKEQSHCLNAFAKGYKYAIKKYTGHHAVPTVTLLSPYLTQIGFAVIDYSLDHNGELPPMKSKEEFYRSLHHYLGDKAVAKFSAQEGRFAPNQSLFGKKLDSIANPRSMICVYQLDTDTEHSHLVLYLNGTVKRLSNQEWLVQKKHSHIESDSLTMRH